MSDFLELVEQDARLIILRELAKQTDGRMNEVMLTRTLDIFGIKRSRDWVRTQIRALHELGALSYDEVGSVFVAEIGRRGMDHVDRRIVLEGVAKPSPAH